MRFWTSWTATRRMEECRMLHCSCYAPSWRTGLLGWTPNWLSWVLTVCAVTPNCREGWDCSASGCSEWSHRQSTSPKLAGTERTKLGLYRQPRDYRWKNVKHLSVPSHTVALWFFFQMWKIDGFLGPGGLELVHGPRDSIRRLGVTAPDDGCESPESILLAAGSRWVQPWGWGKGV